MTSASLPNPLSPHSSRRLVSFTAVAALHAVAILTVIKAYGHFPGATATSQSLITIFLGAAVAAPSLRPDTAVSLEPYIAQAALLPGEDATVVLRIEVLASGKPGRIGDRTESMWIRWGVRLQA